MKQRIAAWTLLVLPVDKHECRDELPAMLTLGGRTASRMPAIVCWWAKAGTKRFVASAAKTRTN